MYQMPIFRVRRSTHGWKANDPSGHEQSGALTSSSDPQHQTVRRVIHLLIGSQERIAIVPQNLYEFWAVATRKPGPPPIGQNGLGMTAHRASLWLQYFQRRFTLLHDQENLIALWRELVRTYEVLGAKAHNARLVAAMQSYGITRLMTFNVAHFRTFTIALIDPVSL